MHGLGNSYIYIDRFKQKITDDILSELAIEVSRATTGIGADGLITIEPSQKAAVKMRIFNKDGSEGKNCGNGLRCVAKYAYEQGLVPSRKMTIETLSGLVNASILSNSKYRGKVCINMGPPALSRKSLPMVGPQQALVVNESFSILNHKLFLTAVSMGNPHAVFFVSGFDKFLHESLGPYIEKDPRFPEGVNVEFVYVESPTSLHCRVWERGSGITQACGTGACAVAVAAVLNQHSKQNVPITIHLEGGDLIVEWESKTGNVLMTGPAVTIANGTFVKN